MFCNQSIFFLIIIFCVYVGWVTDYMEYTVPKSQISDESDDDMDSEDDSAEPHTAREKT